MISKPCYLVLETIFIITAPRTIPFKSTPTKRPDMDSPDPHKGTSSVAVRPDNTPNSDGAATPVIGPSQRNKSRVARRRVPQKAKPSFIEEDDNITTSDDEHYHADDHKPLITLPRREISYRPMDSVKFPKNPNASPSKPVPDPETQPYEEAMMDLNGGQSRPSSVSNPEPELGEVCNDRATPMTPFNIGDSRPASVAAPESEVNLKSGGYDEAVGRGMPNPASPVTSLNPDDQKQKTSSTVRGSSKLNAGGTDQSRLSQGRLKVKLPDLKLEVDETDNNGKQTNAFSLSALPPSTGNSPVAATTERKTATKKRTLKETSKQPRKQAAKRVAQHQKKPTTTGSKTRRPAPVERGLEPSSQVGSYQEDAMMGSDLQEERGPIRPSIPRQAKFKPLKSPVNTHLADTQDLISISSNMSDEFEEDDNVEDDDFMPAGNLNPAKEESTHPKTRATEKNGVVKNAGTDPDASKPKFINSERHDKEKKPDGDSSTKLKPKAPSKMASKPTKVEKILVEETKARRLEQLDQTAPAASTPTQATEASVLCPTEVSYASGSDGQSEHSTARPNPLPTKFRQTKTGGLDKAVNARQADNTVRDCSQEITIVAFGRDVSKSTGTPDKSARVPVSSDQYALASAEDEAPAATSPESATSVLEQPKPRANKTESTRYSTSLGASEVSRINTQRHSAQHQGANDVRSLVPVTEAAEDRAPKRFYEYQNRADKRLADDPVDDTVSEGHGAATSDEGIIDYIDDGNVLEALELPSEPISGIILSESSNYQKPLEHEQNIAAVPQEECSSFINIPAAAVRHDQSAAERNSLKRRFPEDKSDHETTSVDNRVSGLERCLQSASTTSTQGLPNTIFPPMELGKVAKKPRFEAVDSASNSQYEDVVRGPDDSRIRPGGSSDDIFHTGTQGKPVRRTAFVQNCMSNNPRDHSATRFEAMQPNRDQDVDYSSPTNHRKRGRALQQPNSVAKRVLAAISAPEANASIPMSSNHDHSMKSAQDGEEVADSDDRGRAWNKATEPYDGGIAEIMHKSVNVSLFTPPDIVVISWLHLTYEYAGHFAEFEDKGGCNY